MRYGRSAYWELPFRLPQRFHTTKMRVRLVELFAQNPVCHFARCQLLYTEEGKVRQL